MIDKLDIRIPSDAQFRHDLMTLLSWDPAKSRTKPWQRSIHYQARVDLRPLGMDANLHLKCRYGDHDSKLEILDVGKKTYSEIIETIDRLSPLNASSLFIMRLDLAADVQDVSVSWFKDHARFKFKRTEREYGKMQYGLIGRGEIETVQAGSRPNLYRIYNKTHEYKFQFSSMQKFASRGSDPLDFEREFGVKETDVLTRVERQCGGKGIPSGIVTLGDLHKLVEFNPFPALEITAARSRFLPRPEDYTGLEYYTGLGLRYEAHRIGMHAFRKQLNKQTRWNAARTLRNYDAFFPTTGGHQSVSIQDILRSYKQSTLAQLAA